MAEGDEMGVERVAPAVDPSPAEDLAAAAMTLARHFAAGATMWCAAPAWPAHGRHLAVEFVHPVIMGKPALPAVHLEGEDLVGTVRLLARPGDILAAVSEAGDRRVVDLLRRSEAWGLTTLWLGAGARPPSGRADHLIWVEGVDPALAARSGDVVLLYHLLWELTHVVFEHPGLLEAEPVCGDEVCITCSDDGRVGEVQATCEPGRAQVLVNGALETIDVSLVDPVAHGDLVLVHAGVALTALQDGVSGGSGDLGR
jgi:hydrogenase maturation factor